MPKPQSKAITPAAALCRRWLRPGECRCENFPFESYACAEQLPSSYTPPAPAPITPVQPQDAAAGPDAANGDAAGGAIVNDEPASGQAAQVCAASGIIASNIVLFDRPQTALRRMYAADVL